MLFKYIKLRDKCQCFLFLVDCFGRLRWSGCGLKDDKMDSTSEVESIFVHL